MKNSGITRFLRRAVQKAVLPLFPAFEAIGLHVVPAHFDYPISSSADLTDDLFERRSACVGIDWNIDGQRGMAGEVPGVGRPDRAALCPEQSAMTDVTEGGRSIWT